jgi:ribonucleotide reductase alpha subunit
MQEEEMHVIKRNGNSEIVSFDKILKRIKNIGSEAKLSINYTSLAMKVIDQLYNGIETSKLDELTAEQCASLSTQHPDYGTLASRLVISNLHKKTFPSFVQVMNDLYNFKDVNDNHVPLINFDIINIINSNKEYFESIIDYERDYLIDYFGFKTLERAYLMKKNKIILERPQHMWLRVSLGIHFKNFSLEAVKETYDLMSQKYFTHATPTLFNAATPRPQLSSCYLIGMESDSVDGIFNTLKECALISKWSGGIGLHIHNIRSSGSHIRGTNGVSNGLIPMLGVFNKTARYIDQGGKRNGSFAIYLEPHHPDIEDFLDLKKNHGDEELRARDLFYAMWISDLFMERVKTSSTWSLFCPDKCPGLCDVYGEKYKELYLKYEKEKRYTKQIPARDLWIKILDAQMETGTPYLLYKDAANIKSNQKNLGTIKSSNLCVAPETKILTDKGFLEIQSLKNNIVNVWNGKEFSEIEVKQTNDNSALITINFSDGSELTCTKYHKFYIQKDYCKINEKEDIINSKYVEVVEGQNLQKDMKLIKCEYPIIDNNNHLERAYTNGFFSGDGTYNNSLMKETKCNYKSLPNKSYCKRHINYQKDNSISEYCQGICYNKKPIVALYHEKIRLLEYLDYTSIGKEINNKLNVTLNVNLEEKYFVPINYSLKSKLEWFSGYCDADGSICLNKDNQSLKISSIHKEFLLNIKLMLQTCGVSSKVTKNMNERLTNLPNGKGEYQLYKSKTLWRLLVSSNELMKLLELGLSCKRLKIEKREYQRKAVQFVKVVDIIDNGRTDKTFCFNEPKRHTGIFNGVITSNCTEILEYSDEKETAVCNLASISLTKCVVENNINPFKDVIVYTKDNCNWCVLLKALLKKKQITYKEILVDETNRDKLVEDENGVKTLPQLFDEEKYVGGFDTVLNILRNSFDYDKLHYLSKVLTKNLNNIIDINFYPTEKTERSNLLHRPIGIGVQGLADAFILMDIPFESEAAKEINKKIFETIYHGALESSCELAEIRE